MYFKGGAWIEIKQSESASNIAVLNNRFTLQFWVAGDKVDTTEAPALFSLVGDNGNLLMGLYRDPSQDDAVLFFIDDRLVLDTNLTQVDWSDADKFYLISVAAKDSNGVYDYGEIFTDATNDSLDANEIWYDYGLDGCPDSLETGSTDCLDSQSFFYYCNNNPPSNWENVINSKICSSFLKTGLPFTAWDPNGDNWNGTKGFEQNNNYDAGEPFIDMGNGVWDEGESFIDIAGIDLYLNDKKLYHFDNQIEIGDASLMLCAIANKDYTVLENFWYGYIDEVRLWNGFLADTTIAFQYANPKKLGDYYQHEYADSLIGLWRFNLESPSSSIVDETGNGNDGIIYTFSDKYFVELSKKGVQ